MAFFQEQIDKTMDQLERLSGRERMLVSVGGLAALLLVGFLVSYVLNNSLRNIEAYNRDLEIQLERIMQKQSEYLAARKKIRELERRIGRDSVQRLEPFLDSASQRFNLTITSMNPTSLGTQRDPKSRVKEKSVQVKLEKASLAAVAKFFEAIERSGKMVKIRKIRMKPNFSDNQKVDVELIVSTFLLTK